LFGISDNRFVALFLTHFNQVDVLLKRGAEAFDGIDRIVEFLPLAHQILRFLSVIPDGRIFRALVQIAKALVCLIPVKDASSAGLWPA
jgi:hypothetical protein